MTSSALWTQKELEEIYMCSLPEGFKATGVSIDSRTLQPGDLYFAIKGVQQDGHRFIGDAMQKGASAVISSHDIPSLSCPVIHVEDTLEALQILGRTSRLRTKAKVIAITGSVGKTSTKEILHQTLSPFGKVASAEASYNNHWGVPLTLSRIPQDAKYAILEIGMNNKGEIAPLSEMVSPHVAIITAVAPAHIGNMGSLEAIAQEKSDIFSGVIENGIAIIPFMPAFLPLWRAKAERFKASTFFTFGEDPQADVSLISFSQRGGEKATVKAAFRDHRYTFTSHLQGRHMAQNCLISLCLAKALRLDVTKIINALGTLETPKNRCQVLNLEIDKKNIVLLDDSFNANLTSMLAGLRTFLTIPLPQGGRRIAVLGEMLELGSFAIDHHQQISDFCLNHPIDHVFLCGGKALKQGFTNLSPQKYTAYAPTIEELLPQLKEFIQDKDIIFMKGSKGSRVYKGVEMLLQGSALL